MLSLVGVVTAVTSESIGAVVSLAVFSSKSLSSLLEEEQEILIVKPIQETNK